VRPTNISDLTPGTRVCAYWSQQYRCLYPGTVAQPSSPDPELDSHFVNVEFDDGDSGRINIDDIRLLPSDYPVVGRFLNLFWPCITFLQQMCVVKRFVMRFVTLIL
jgi:hypothetical protein